MEQTADPKRYNQLSIGLGLIAGYVDTLGFVALFGLFTAHVTGNFVLIGSELARPSHGVLIKFLAFLAFVVSVAFTRLFVIWLERRSVPSLRPIFLLQLILLIGFMALGSLASPLSDVASPLALLAGMLGAAAMGVQNASSRLVLNQLTPTTVMTGNVTQLVIDVVDILRGAADETVRKRSVKFLWPIVAFAIGAICGGLGYIHFHFFALLLPVGILAWFAYSEK
jgi:uncharacterized membrane protein YoaK (UPF0700 family)